MTIGADVTTSSITCCPFTDRNEPLRYRRPDDRIPGVEITYAETLREVGTSKGVLRYHEAGDGPPLLLLHGSGPGVTGWRNFRGNLGFFAEHFRCIVLEFPGFGVSDDFGGHPMLDAQGSVPVFLDALGVDKVDVIGNSMGGGVGINFAITQPDRIGKLITIGGIGTNIYSPAPARASACCRSSPRTRPGSAWWTGSTRWSTTPSWSPRLIEERWELATDPETLASARRMYGKAAFAAMTKMMRNADFPLPWAIMHKVKAPTLLTWGRDDRVSPLDMSLIPMRTIPNAELHVFPNCGHWVMIEQKAAFESTALGFLRRA